MRAGWYIRHDDAALRQWYWWDADQGSFTRIVEMATRYESKAEAKEALLARDMPRWRPDARVVEVT